MLRASFGLLLTATTASACIPQASVAPGVYAESQVVSLSCKNGGNASIVYTTDGTDPIKYGHKYTGPLLLTPQGGNGFGGYMLRVVSVAFGSRTLGEEEFRYAIAGRPEMTGVLAQCTVSDPSKSDCGYDGINQGECEGKGCCWQPINPNPNNYPWCFHPGSSPSPPSPPTPSPPTPPSPPSPGLNNSAVMIQVFDWNAATQGGWYGKIQAQSNAIKYFDFAWFPPPAMSADQHGYIPTQLNVLNGHYGSESELRSAIQSIAPCKAVSDIVINHRGGSSDWGDFTNPSFGDSHGIYHAIANGDEGFSQSPPSDPMHNAPMQNRGAPDTGENYESARDEDHTNSNVQSDIISWMQHLKSIGFVGWRYDFVKGYAGKYVGLYNSKTGAEFSVGEYWETNKQGELANWVSQTTAGGGTSLVFAYPLKQALNNAFNNNDMTQLGNFAWNSGMSWKNVVTFVSNHDTAAPQNLFPIHTGSVYLAYVYVLTHPGLASVFWDHMFENVDNANHYGTNKVTNKAITTLQEHIVLLMRIRRINSIGLSSSVSVQKNANNEYAACIDNKVYVKIGSGTSFSPPAGYGIAYSGDNYCLWMQGM